MKKDLRSRTIYTVLLPSIISNNDSISSLCVNKFFIKELSKYKKPTMNVEFKRCQRFSTRYTKMRCTVDVRFLGKCDIPYRIFAVCDAISNKPVLTDDEMNKLKTSAYLYVKDMLEHDVKLLELYPRDLIYPNSDAITGITFDEIKEEPKAIDDSPFHNNTEEMVIRVFKDQGDTGKKAFTEEDDECYQRLVKNNFQSYV